MWVVDVVVGHVGGGRIIVFVCWACEQPLAGTQERRIDWMKRHEAAQGHKTYLTTKVDADSL